MEQLRKWFFDLFNLLSTQSGMASSGGGGTVTEEESTDESGEEEETEQESEEQEESGEDDEEGEESEDGDEDSGNNLGKDRSKYVPRKRFDQVNTRAQELEALEEAGILLRDAEGRLRVNPKAVKNESHDNGEDSESGQEFYFKESDVDGESWPLVQKINKGFKHYENLANQFAYALNQLMAENAILREYPEFLQKESPLRKKAMDILKNDPEFKTTYRGNPRRGFFAVKRAAELLEGRKPDKDKKKKKGFIIGRGDSGKKTPKVLDLSTMSKEDLDKLEKAENERLNRLKSRK